MIQPPVLFHEQPKAYVISLHRATERRMRFFSAAKRHGWKVDVLTAVDKDEIVRERVNSSFEVVRPKADSDFSVQNVRKTPDGPVLSPGACACALSHMQAWRRMLAEGLPAICVFEDDAILEQPFEISSIPGDADMVFLNDRVRALLPDGIEDADSLEQWAEHHFCALAIPGCGLEAYIITAKGARKALELMSRIRMPIDLQLFACGRATDLISHHLAKERPTGVPILELYVTRDTYTRHEDGGVSYRRGNNSYPKVQFGSGGLKIPDWVNCDLPHYDISKPLNLASESAQFIFAEHVIEHVTPRDAWRFLLECKRILKPGGIVRLCFPDLKRILHAKTDVFDRLCSRGGRTDGSRQGSIETTLFCHGHLGAWTADSLSTLLEGAGFSVTECRPGQSLHPELQNIDQHWKTVGWEINDTETTVLEGQKPRQAALD